MIAVIMKNKKVLLIICNSVYLNVKRTYLIVYIDKKSIGFKDKKIN